MLTATQNLIDVVKQVERSIGQRYECPFRINGQRCFLYGQDHYFMITGLDWEEKSIVVEHAHSLEEAKRDMFEDGDRFYVDEMTENEIVDAIIDEVET